MAAEYGVMVDDRGGNVIDRRNIANTSDRNNPRVSLRQSCAQPQLIAYCSIIVTSS